MVAAPRVSLNKTAILLLAVVAFDQLVLQPNLPDRKIEQLNGGIDDQHDYYYAQSGMLSDPDHFLRREPSSPVLDGMKKVRVKQGENFRVVPITISGMKFYYGGPYFIILDTVGLGDALMARLPTGDPARWRIGHPIRSLPDGYRLARETGDISLMHPALGDYYSKLRLLTSGELFTMERFKTIAGFQLGLYDDLLREYAKEHP